MKAKEFIPQSKPRNFVVKNQKTAGAGAHKDKKRAEKQGDVKHKNKFNYKQDNWSQDFERRMKEGVTEGGEYNKFKVGQRATYKNSQGQEFPVIVTAVDFDEDAVKVRSADNKPFPNSGGDLEIVVDPGWKFLSPEPRVDPDSIIAVSPNMRKTTERIRDPEDWDEGNSEPPNNFAVYINGKKWKVFQGRGQFADDYKEMQHFRQLQNWAQQKSAQSGKKWEVYKTGEPATA
jgi:hypothetical protein